MKKTLYAFYFSAIWACAFQLQPSSLTLSPEEILKYHIVASRAKDEIALQYKKRLESLAIIDKQAVYALIQKKYPTSVVAYLDLTDVRGNVVYRAKLHRQNDYSTLFVDAGNGRILGETNETTSFH